MTVEYPKLRFSTGLDVDGMDMAEWLSHAQFDIRRASVGMRVMGWEREAEDAEGICYSILGLLSKLRRLSEEEGLFEDEEKWDDEEAKE